VCCLSKLENLCEAAAAVVVVAVVDDDALMLHRVYTIETYQ